MARALVVEDDQSLGNLLCHTLSKAGITSVCVAKTVMFKPLNVKALVAFVAELAPLPAHG